MLEVNQEWYVFEEIYYPYVARKINHIVDVDTNENFLEYPIGENPYIGFKVFVLNSEKRELAFIEKYQIEKLTEIRNELKDLKEIVKNSSINDLSPEIFEYITQRIQEMKENKNYVLNINLSPLKTFQNSIKYFSRNIKQVKLEIEIIHTKPIIEDLSEVEKFSNLLKYEESFYSVKKISQQQKSCNINKIFPRFNSVITIEGKSAPEITLILPPGWTVEENGKGISVELYDQDKINKKAKLIEKFNMECFIKQMNNKLSFSYLIDSKSDCESFFKFSNHIKNSKNPKIFFTYNSTITSHIKWVSIIPFLFIFSIVVLWIIFIIDVINLKEFDFNFTYLLSSIIILLTFTFYYITLIKDGYIIPFMDWFFKTFFIFLFSLIMIFCLGVIL